MAEYGRRQTERADGDFAVDADGVDARRRQLVDRDWVWCNQVHGADVVVVDEAVPVPGADADALVSCRTDVVLTVQTADCVPVVLTTPDGAFGVAHVGWRGARAGVLDATVSALEELGADRSAVHAVLGAHISAPYYEFGQADLTALALQFGPDVVAATVAGEPALDMGRLVHAALAACDVHRIDDSEVRCTASSTLADGSPRYFSHRARGDTGRMATAVWRTR